MCSNSYFNHYIKVGQLPKCVISSSEMAGQPLAKRAVSSAKICRKSNMSMTQEKMYMNVDDVCAVLGVSKAFAYKIMKGYNEELKERVFLVIPGKISTKFLAEKIYGMKVEE